VFSRHDNMKAIVYEHYGAPEVLQLRELPTPVPGRNEVLIRVHATTASSGDWRVRSLDVPAGFGLLARLALGVFRPRQPILGTELAGEIVAVGQDVRRFKVGDQVFAFPGARMGSYVEYKALPEDGPLALKPPNLSYEEAAALSFGGMTALHFLRKAGVKPGDQVLINGASGAVGTAAVQLAKHFGAEVTGVCGTGNLTLVRSIGADKVIDYTREDFTTGGQTYDIIMDTAGTATWSRSKHALKPGGRLLAVLGSLPALLQAPWVALTSSRRVIGGPSPERVEDLRFLAELAAAGKYRPVIDRRFAFDQMVEAHRHVDAGHKKGSVVVTVGT
jgi:NADPH:quinone reductase-like Zn-dependent oxidoreductase